MTPFIHRVILTMYIVVIMSIILMMPAHIGAWSQIRTTYRDNCTEGDELEVFVYFYTNTCITTGCLPNEDKHPTLHSADWIQYQCLPDGELVVIPNYLHQVRWKWVDRCENVTIRRIEAYADCYCGNWYDFCTTSNHLVTSACGQCPCHEQTKAYCIESSPYIQEPIQNISSNQYFYGEIRLADQSAGDSQIPPYGRTVFSLVLSMVFFLVVTSFECIL